MDISDDRLNYISVLKRREIEARLLVPLLEALDKKFGTKRVLAVTQQIIEDIAQHQGRELTESIGGTTLVHFAASLDSWKKDDALQIEMLEQTEQRLSFNVTRCAYVDMYLRLGVPNLGVLLSCNRDQALIEGFNPQIQLQRTQTIMEGAPFCDFRYVMREKIESMKILLVMRHAKSSWADPGLNDYNRPLNKRGKYDAPRMGRLLRDKDLTPQLIVSSSARRAQATAESVADQSGYLEEIQFRQDLYAADLETCLEVIRGLPNEYDRILLIGHNPGLEELVEILTGSEEHLPTASLAYIQLPSGSWKSIGEAATGKLVNIWRPRELP